MLVDYIRIINAQKKFKLKDDFTFIEFEDISEKMVEEEDDIAVPDHFEIWASVKVPYDGVMPESYKALNLIIGDWVEKHEKPLTDVIHKELEAHLQELYPGSNTAELNGQNPDDSAIWLDQLDYMPRVNENEKYLVIEIELVLDVEQD